MKIAFRFNYSRLGANVFIIFSIALAVFFDLLNGYFLLTKGSSIIGATHKATIIIFSCIILIIGNPYKFLINLFIFLSVIFSFVALTTFSEGGSYIISDLKIYLRVFYPFFLVLALQHCLSKYPETLITLRRSFYFYGLIASVAIFSNAITGIGHKTYGDYAFGYQSFFYAANEIGLVLVAISAFTFVQAFKGGKVHPSILLLALMMGGSAFAIGSITGMIGVFVSFIVILLLVLLTVKARTPAFRIFKWSGVIFLTTLSIIAYFAVQKVLTEYPYVSDKVERILSGEGSRDNLGYAASEYLFSQKERKLIIGNGYTEHGKTFTKYYPHKKGELAIVERDPYDVIGTFGLLLGGFVLLLYYAFPVYLIYLSKLKLTYESISSVYILSFMVLHSIYAGHLIFSPLVNTFYFSIGVYTYMQIQKQRRERCSLLTVNT